MSTILKALQRLEQEKDSLKPTGPTPVFSKAPPARGSVVAWLLSPWIRWGMVGCVIVVLGAAALHFYRQSNTRLSDRADRFAGMEKRAAGRQPNPPAAAAPAEKKQSAAAGPARSIPAAKRMTGRPSSGPQPQARPSRAAPIPPQHDPAQAPAATRSTSQPPAGQASVAAASPAQPSADAGRSSEVVGRPDAANPVAPQAAATTNPALPASAGNAGPAQATKKPSNAYTNTPALRDGRLKVHAIAWSSEVEERMAVVNSRIVHEGDTVDDFIIVAIRPDDLVVREKEKGLWKVVFGRP